MCSWGLGPRARAAERLLKQALRLQQTGPATRELDAKKDLVGDIMVWTSRQLAVTGNEGCAAGCMRTEGPSRMTRCLGLAEWRGRGRADWVWPHQAAGLITHTLGIMAAG